LLSLYLNLYKSHSRDEKFVIFLLIIVSLLIKNFSEFFKKAVEKLFFLMDIEIIGDDFTLILYNFI